MADVGDIFPGTGERIVGKVKNPDGPGYWLQGEYGGVFAVDDNLGTSGPTAPFHGSYFGIDPAHRNDPNRRFTGIETTGAGGYRSISSNPNEGGYAFNPATRPSPPPPPPTAAQQRANAPGAASAKGELASFLHQYGLPASLADRLWDEEYVRNGTPINTIIDVKLPNTTEYKQRFPGLTALRERQNRGEAVQIPSIGEYIGLEAGIAGVLEDAGIPKGLWDEPSELAKFIGGSTSPKEVEDRIAFARNVAFSMPVETREELNRVYGIEPGELVAYVLDPDKALPEIEKRVLGAGIGGTAKRTGFGLLTQAEMEQLAGTGTTEAQAAERFGTLTNVGEGLFAETVEEAAAGEDLNRATQIGFAGGSAEADRQMTQRRRRRAAAFEGGGGAGGGGAGRTGLGSS